jgi:hypothetical protein
MEYLFVTSDYLYSVQGEVTANGASTRLGCLGPSKALASLGYDAATYSVASGMAAALEVVGSAKRVVFGEMFAAEGGWDVPISRYRELLGRIAEPRERVLFSIADDHFADPAFGGFYREVLPECLAVTTISESLAATLRPLTSRPVLIAPEPYEGARGAPHAFSARKPPAALAWLARRIGVPEDTWRVRLLWFGYPMNLAPLIDLLPQLDEMARRYPLHLTCATQPVPAAQALAAARPHLGTSFVPWAPLALERLLASHDIVIIPSSWRDPVKRAKSPNRLVSALNAGRFVVAHPLPAYAPYAEFAWLGEDLCAGIEWALRHPREVLDRIARGQAFIDQRHSPVTVARFWLDAFHPKN